MIIVLVGKPGVGKSSIARRLEEMCGNKVRHISSGQLAREMADSADREELAKGELFNEDKMRGAIKRSVYNVLMDGYDVVLDGFPRSVDQMKWLTETFKSRFIMVNVECCTSDIIKRLTVRGRMDDNKGAISKRIAHYSDFAKDIDECDLISNRLEIGKFKVISVESSNDRTIHSVTCEVMDRLFDLCGGEHYENSEYR